MGTRGLWGLRHKNKDYLTYNHFDSYPSWLGNVMLETIRKYSDDEMKHVAEEIKLVDEHDKPCEEAVEQVKRIIMDEDEFNKIMESKGYLKDMIDDIIESHGYKPGELEKSNEYYELLHIAQGDPDCYFSRGLRYMTDDSDFMFDSVFCEWAYIINLDVNALEVYKGFNKEFKNQREPYVWDKKDKYYACSPLVDIPFDRIRENNNTLPELIKELTGKEVD